MIKGIIPDENAPAVALPPGFIPLRALPASTEYAYKSNE